MLGICIGFDGYAYSRNEWAYMIDNFGVTDVFEHGYNVVEVEGYPKSQIVQHASELPAANLVVLAPPEGREVRGEIPLPEFKHPDQAIYISGQNNVNFDPAFLKGVEYQSVWIPSVKHEFFALVATACVLYDRKVKAWAT